MIPAEYAEAYELMALASAGLLHMTLADMDALPDRLVRQFREIAAVRAEVNERHQELEEVKTKGDQGGNKRAG